MFRHSRSPQPADLITSEKRPSSLSYRRASIPHITPISPSTNLTTRRAPLAPLDPQAAHALHADDQMSSSSVLAYTDPAPERERATDLARFNIGRPIATHRTASDDSLTSVQAVRRRSIPNHLHTSGTGLRPPPAPPRTSRRPSHAPSASVSSNRRPSLPSIHLQPSSPMLSPASGPSADSYGSPNLVHPASDDIYSNLSSFTFGAARSSRGEYRDMANPFSSGSSCSNSSADLTPRPSVSGPSSAAYASRQRTPKDFDDEGERADDEDDEEAARHTRAKMRAMNDGTRRPSLPVSTYLAGRSSSPSPTSVSSSQGSPQSSPDSPYDHSVHVSSARASHSNGEGEGVDLDTDLEFDFHHHSSPGATADAESSDTASQHTFGGTDSHHYDESIDPADSDDRMSVSEDHLDDVDKDRPGSVSSVVLTKLAVRGLGSNESAGSSSRLERRGSLPWNIPGASPASPSSPARDREDSITTVTGRRMSRSMDDMLPLTAVEPMAQAVSLPHCSTDWRSFGASQDASLQSTPPSLDQATGELAYVGLNLDYIFSRSPSDGSGDRHSISSSTSWVQPDSKRPLKAAGSGFHAFDFPAWGIAVRGDRRPSAISVATMGADDPFARVTGRLDPIYAAQKRDWSFMTEKADAVSKASGMLVTGSSAPRVIMPGAQEIWRQEYVGRFKVDKLLLKPDDPSKPPQQRVNVRHINDPFSKGNIRGGPTAVIHKHSRATAFSIFRKYGLLNRGQRSGSHSMSTSGSILLATKKVQEQYTSTRTTSQLNSHGLLKDGDNAVRPRSSPAGDGTHRPRSQSRDKSKKDKGKVKGPSSRRFSANQNQSASVASTSASDTGTSSQTTSHGSVSSRTTVDEDPSTSKTYYALPSSSIASVTMSSTVVDHPLAMSDATSSSASTVTASPPSSSYGYRSSSNASKLTRTSHPSLRTNPDDDDFPPRTSHAEAFATLDTTSLEYLRGRPEQRSDHDSSHNRGLADRWRRLLLGQNAGKSASRTQPGLPSASLEGHYTPPWLTMAPRSKQEERERVIQNLNESFKDVGLLPSFRPSRTDKTKSRRSHKPEPPVNIFERVPKDALYMLLPLWAGETDPASAISSEDPSMYAIPVEERQYLLVYYVAFEEETTKKRPRGDSHSAAAPPSAKPSKSVVLNAFRVCGRLVSYQDLLGTGVRVPIEGLSITGPMAEAHSILPPPLTRSLYQDDYVIGTCSKRENGMEFIPEGLNRLGLCMPFEKPPDEEEPLWELTPIGRAAVEMAWLGCLSMTSFAVDAHPH